MWRPTPCDILVKQFKEENPSSHIFKIENFSLLNKYQIKQVDSSVFTISGHKWKLILHPEGNDQDKGKGYVSLYLEYHDSSQIKATFQLFILNQKKDSMLSQQGVVNFDKTNKKWGAARLISIDNLKDSEEEYLMGNCSIFGVKLSGSTVNNEAATAESFSLIEKPPKNKVTWMMEKYSAFDQEKCFSHEFVIGNRKWRIQINPKGEYEAKDKYISAYLLARGFEENTPKTKTYAKYIIKVLNKTKEKPHHFYTTSYWFLEEDNGFGWRPFMPLGDLNRGFLVENKLRVQVEIEVVSVTRYS